MREKGRQEVEAAHFTTPKPRASRREAKGENNAVLCSSCCNFKFNDGLCSPTGVWVARDCGGYNKPGITMFTRA